LHIESEITLLKLAHQQGVPCPTVVEHLTALGIDVKQHRFHRLVWHKLANDAVPDVDLKAYALSLIQVVQSLHRLGILHCDIKPANVLWNSVTKTAFLADFGHAQRAVAAKSYAGTVGYTAPEVLQKDVPHSCQTEAFSVGQTLLNVSSKVQVGTGMMHVERVAEQLALEDPEMRISLDDAREELLASFPLQRVA
jgi:serine/threonine protein kinase